MPYITLSVFRWEIDAVKTLPDYMKLCFLALYNTVNEMAYDTLKEQGVDIIPHLTKAWADMCKAFLVEAKWCDTKYTPTFKAYLDNGWQSVSGVLILVHAYFFTSKNITKEALEGLDEHHDLLRWSAMIFRLCNDLGTSTAELERGETANSITCYMRDTGLSEEHARVYIRGLIDDTWKKMNEDGVANSPFAKPFVETVFNLARIAQCTYQHGDGHGAPDIRSKNRVSSLIIEPIKLKKEKIGELC
uniref:Terpene synthase metal-binding domain-containing protein n=1 Tax=Davidia involucrata TaxID=16924 RepID=A0A5B7B6Z2_DAVIN